MKYFILIAVGVLFYAMPLIAEQNTPLFNWSLLAGGSSNIEFGEEKNGGLLYNRVDLKFNFLSSGFTLRGEVLDRRPLTFELDSDHRIFGDPEKWVTNYLGGLYHKSTGSRFLFGALDEWGLSARIRNPWIRSPPYSENHSPLIADLKTTVSVTKNDELYLYLSSPFFNIFDNVKLRAFISAQTEIKDFKPAISGGVEFSLPNKTGVLFETFYTGAVLPPTKNSSWFSNPPPLPERDFKLYAFGLLFHNQLLSVSSDFALSETFAWGAGIYGSFGITLTPALSFGGGTQSLRQARPLAVSLSIDWADKKFVYRDGANHGEGFRSAGKIEWKGKGSSLLRFSTILRAPAAGEDFNRSSTNFYYRFPARNARNAGNFPVQLTRMSFTADRNAENLSKISDKFSGYIGFSVDLRKIGINTPVGVYISGSINGLSESNSPVSTFPLSKTPFDVDNTDISCEFTWSPLNLQFKSKIGCSNNIKKDETLWEYSFSTAVSFKNGRLSLKAATPNFQEKWNWTLSWRLETGK